MGKTPELGIKVRVDPTIDAKKLKDAINGEIKKRNDADDTEKVKIKVDVDHFQNSLSTQLKEELKSVNRDLKYYLGNLTQNADKLDDVVVNLFGNADFSKKIKDQFNEVNRTLDVFKNELFNTNKIYEVAFKNIDFNSFTKFKALLNEFKTDFEDLTDVDKSGILDNAEELVPQFNKLVEKARVLESGLKGLTSIKGRPDLLKTLGFSPNEYTVLTEGLNSLKSTLTSLLGIKTSGDFVKNSVDVVDLVRDVNDNFLTQQFDDVEIFLNKLDDVIQKRNEFFKELQAKEFVPPKEGHNKGDIESTTENYSDILSVLVAQQNALNVAKQTTVGIEDQLITKTQSVRNAVSEELKYLRDFLKDVDTGAIQAKVNDVQRMADEVKNAISVINQAESKRKNNKPQQTTSTPAEQKPSDENDIIKYKQALESIKTGINNAKLDIVDFKIFLSEHKNDFGEMTGDVQAYVAALNEIDYAKLNEAMTSKATTHKEVAPEANVAPVDIPGRVKLENKDVVAPDKPVNIPGKVTLSNEDVIVPTTPVNIPGKVTLGKNDVISPTEPIEILGKVTLGEDDIKVPDTPIAIKGKAPASSSKNSVTTDNKLSFDDSKIVNEIQGVGSHLESIENILGEQKKTLDKIATSAKNSKTSSSGTIKKTTNFDKLTLLYNNISALEKKRSGLFKDSDAAALKEVNNQLSITRKEINSLERAMKKRGENPLDSQIVNKAKNSAEFEAKNTDIDFKTKRIEFVRDSYIKVLREISKDQASLLNITDKNLESALQQNISRNLKYLEEARAELLSYNADADNAWKEIESAKSKISISDAEVVETSIKKEETRKAKELKDQQKLIDTIKKKLDRKLLEYKKFNFLSSEENKELNKYNYEAASDELADFLRQADREGLSDDKRIKDALKKYALEKKAVIGYYKKVAAESTASLAPSEKEIISLTRKVGEYKTYIDRLSSTHKHGDRLDAAKQEYARLEALVDIIKNVQKNNGTNKDTLVKNWAIENKIEDVVSLGDAFDYITRKVVEFRNETSDLKNIKTLEDSVIRGRTVAINLASNLEKYLERNRRVESSEYGPQIRDIIDQLNTDDGWKNYPKIEENVAKLKYFIHDAGLETETLSEKFEKLFGEHLSTALVMGALHQLQQSLQIMFQNVVDIDTAMAELRKVSNMTAQDMANYMEQAADQAARLGVSITSYVSSTAD